MILPTKRELIGIVMILFVIIGVTYANIRVAERRARDVQRRADISAVTNALNVYFEDYGFYPPSTDDGKIIACKGQNYDEVIEKLRVSDFDTTIYFSGFRGCEWSRDALADPTTGTPYMKDALPQDPKLGLGYSYYYISNTRRFQLFSFLEGESQEDGYNPGVVERALMCGSAVCNFGKASGVTPLDISLEEYERILEEERSGK